LLREKIYFDQKGLITTKLKIKKVPAIVAQEGKGLKIEEVNTPWKEVETNVYI
jgi:hypothetical protein